jgi:hypothetical protein
MLVRAGRRVLAGAGAVVALAMTTLYLVIIGEEGDDPFWSVAPWVAAMLVGAGAAVVAAIAGDERLARGSAVVAAALLAALGLVSILSIGLGFLLAALLAALAAAAAHPATV